MVCLASTSSLRYIEFVIVFAALIKQVTANESETCYPEQCGVNEFCCDGLCCTYYKQNWYTWMLMILLVSVIVLTCFCFPRSPWGPEPYEPVQYYLQTTGSNAHDLPHTKSYQQQPQYPIYQTFESPGPPQYHPYRYERLVQQGSQEVTRYPEPSAPPKTP